METPSFTMYCNSIVLFMISLSSADSVCQRFKVDAFRETEARQPPHSNTLFGASETLFSDRSSYVHISEDVGPVISIGDFTGDRYVDLLTIPDYRERRSVQILKWNHSSYSFEKGECQSSPAEPTKFYLGDVDTISSQATIVTAVAFDSNSDGSLDALLSVYTPNLSYTGVLLLGDGSGCLHFHQILPGLTPGMLLVDANDDLSPDLFHIDSQGEREFYINHPPGLFTKKTWRPRQQSDPCTPTSPFNSNAFADINGDCLPDLVVSTSCGLEVWFNAGLENTPTSRWMVGQEFRKGRHNFFEQVWSDNGVHNVLLNRSIWEADSGDGRAMFTDFNGDGTIDIGVMNSEYRNLRISYNVQDQGRGKLCRASSMWHLQTKLALSNVFVSDSIFGNTRIQSSFRVGDFNFDGKADILAISGETGTLTLFQAHSSEDVYSRMGKLSRSVGLSYFAKAFLFALTGTYTDQRADQVSTVTYRQRSDMSMLHGIEDPLGAAFFDLDESGRQDILVSQVHGTRLIWNSYSESEDPLFFKTTAVDAAQHTWRSVTTGKHSFSPLPGNTFKLTYGGRYGREVHTCTQCPQTGFMSLQTCSCTFGIPNIANYIEELAMGGATGVRTWKNLMPNALAVVWPQRLSPRKVTKWKISYLSRGRYGQMKRITLVLFGALIVLLFAIIYVHGVERLKERSSNLAIRYP